MDIGTNKGWQCRVAPSLGVLEGTPEEVWGTRDYYGDIMNSDDLVYRDAPAIFFGLYGLPDFYTLWRHKGPKCILWAGSDIRHFVNGYWLDDVGHIRLDPEALARWIDKNCSSYVENGVEHEALMTIGINSRIVPSFMGDVNDYEVSYVQADRPSVYLSVSGDNFAMYGWEQVELIADKCQVDFHLYGNTKPWTSKHANIFVHGRVPKEQMNAEIQTMQAGLRTLEFDGFSEILAKSVLWGQHPISYIAYPHVTNYKDMRGLIDQLNALKKKKEPNLAAREWYMKNLNRYPWNNRL